MYSTLLGDATFHELLLVFDRDIAIAARRGRCLLCGSVVHSAQYRRKPRGRPAGLGDEHDWRFSFCCARDGCRARKTPPSLRFLGRKVYLAAMVVLIAIMREGATAARMRQLSGLVGVDRRTVERWREWWRDTFTANPFWQIGRAAFMPPVDQDRLPASLIERFTGPWRGAAHCAAALPRPDHRRRQARSITAFPDPQRMLVAGNPGLDLQSVRPDPQERRRDRAGTRSPSP